MLTAIRKIESDLKKIPSRDLSYGTLDGQISHHDEIQSFIRQAVSNLPEPQQTRIINEFENYGPIQDLIYDESVTEIIINGPDSVWFEKSGKLQAHPDSFASDLTYSNFINRICSVSHAQYTLDRPMLDGKFLDFRIHLISDEITKTKTVISLRRHPKNPWTLESFLHSEWCDANSIKAIKKIIHENENFIVIGGTGSGKTSLLNACLQEIAPNCRSILIEDTEELKVPNQISTRLLTRKDAQGILSNIDQSELLKQALRMRPDRIIMGEIRSVEAKDFLMALSTGHQGSFASLHATDAHQALLRLEMLIQLGAPNWSLEAIRNLIFLSLQKILVVERNSSGKRVLKGIYQICSRETSGILIERCT